jgi:hypothetical protein
MRLGGVRGVGLGYLVGVVVRLISVGVLLMGGLLVAGITGKAALAAGICTMVYALSAMGAEVWVVVRGLSKQAGSFRR